MPTRLPRYLPTAVGSICDESMSESTRPARPGARTTPAPDLFLTQTLPTPQA